MSIKRAFTAAAALAVALTLSATTLEAKTSPASSPSSVSLPFQAASSPDSIGVPAENIPVLTGKITDAKDYAAKNKVAVIYIIEGKEDFEKLPAERVGRLIAKKLGKEGIPAVIFKDPTGALVSGGYEGPYISTSLIRQDGGIFYIVEDHKLQGSYTPIKAIQNIEDGSFGKENREHLPKSSTPGVTLTSLEIQ
ncbi:MAG: hypothetical protein K9G62_00200 [Alphaproteobacteria bacterium]|nr:hypothetical protein [Alphaproteobacteria bacterium]